jgi:DNA repair photolyase
MKAIYEPRGRAREYAALACNLFTGCPNGCRYCFAPQCLRISREQFRSDVRPRPGILEALAREAPKYSGDPRRVLLCFTCDPFPHPLFGKTITREALLILGQNGVRADVLTKNPRYALKTCLLPLRRYRQRLGVSLVWSCEWRARRWEPAANSIADRIGAIGQARRFGIPTWLSVEPVIDAEQALEAIRYVGRLVDFVKVGPINHDRRLKADVDWRMVYCAARNELEKIGVGFYLKRDLCLAAGVPADDEHQYGSFAAAEAARAEGWGP